MDPLDSLSLQEISARTLGHYEAQAEAFWRGTRDHDVQQNLRALLDALVGPGPHSILDFGCGPGRDLLSLKQHGCRVVGLDGCAAFVEHARKLTGAEVWQQDFLKLNLPTDEFDGVFANASLFHVPRQELTRVIEQLRSCLKPSGVLFVSNPRGDNREGWSGERYGTYLDEAAWTDLFLGAGLDALHHYYRPEGLPRDQQPWFASVWRRGA